MEQIINTANTEVTGEISPNVPVSGKQTPCGCLHEQCSNCHGTGNGKFGTCVHAIYCPCPKCSPTC